MWRVLQAWLRRPLIYREHGRAIRSIAVTTTKASRMARDPKTGRALTVEITESAAQVIMAVLFAAQR